MADSRTVETHISTLFFTGDRVYKLAKRVQLPFLDTTRPADRLRLAARELELNRRFAPDVYLGLAEVEEQGEIVDRMIVMRRLPEDRRLSRLVGDPDFGDHLRSVARRVASIHASETPITDAPMATAETLATNWRDNLAALRPYVGSVIDADDFTAVERMALDYVSNRGRLLEQRIEDGFVCDGHGDLLADDIFCLDDGPRILDCLAFDDALRIGDVLNDIAFLVMDVHRLAGADAARSLIRRYQEFSNEHHPSSLAHHYVAYRAHVRAKVATLRAAQGTAQDVELARTYHRLALHHLDRARIRVIMVGGGPGVGKTLLSERLARHYGYVHLATDEIRHDVAHIPHGQHAVAAPGEGPYEPVMVDATYDEQRREAVVLVERGHGVVLDGSWTSERHRSEMRRAVEAVGAELIEIECSVDDATARERIAQRRAERFEPSDATPDLVDYLGSRRDPWPTAHGISTRTQIDETVRHTIDHIEGR